jgi:hypothetical protein
LDHTAHSDADKVLVFSRSTAGLGTIYPVSYIIKDSVISATSGQMVEEACTVARAVTGFKTE